jgi:hypothetical protein
MENLINWFNGKKTTIGAIILFIAVMPHIDEYVGQNLVDILNYIGQAFVGIGIMHKGVKVAK